MLEGLHFCYEKVCLNKWEKILPLCLPLSEIQKEFVIYLLYEATMFLKLGVILIFGDRSYCMCYECHAFEYINAHVICIYKFSTTSSVSDLLMGQSYTQKVCFIHLGTKPPGFVVPCLEKPNCLHSALPISSNSHIKH